MPDAPDFDLNAFLPYRINAAASRISRAFAEKYRDEFGISIPEWRVQELLKEHKLGYWQVQVRFYGDEAVNKAKAEVVKKAFKKFHSINGHVYL